LVGNFITNVSVPYNVTQINVNINEDLDKAFREIVFKKKGLRRGAMLEAFEEAVELWIRENKKK